MNFIQFKELVEIPVTQLINPAILDNPISDEELEKLIADEDLSDEEGIHPEVKIPATAEVTPETTTTQEPTGTDTEPYKSPKPVEVIPETIPVPPIEVVEPSQPTEEPLMTTDEPTVPSSSEESVTSIS